MSLFEANEPNTNPIKKHPITFTVKVAIHEESGKYIEKISFVKNLETAPSAPPRPTITMFNNILFIKIY
tara:strand:+ start:22 stop:228 length:207 start_codon:yes stop_codon:yes gene_type:complete